MSTEREEETLVMPKIESPVKEGSPSNDQQKEPGKLA